MKRWAFGRTPLRAPHKTLLLCLASAPACGPDQVRLELPVPENAAAVILAFEHRDGLGMAAFDPRAADVSQLPIISRLRGEGTAHLLVYETPLDALQLEPGPLQLDDEGEPLPRPQSMLSSRLAAGAASPWSTSVELPPSLERVRIVGVRCPVFESGALDVGRDSQSALITGLPEGNALVITAEPVRWWRLTETALEAVMPPDLRNFEPSALASSKDGTLWVADADGRVFRGRLGERFTDTGDLPRTMGCPKTRTEPIDFIAPSPEEGPTQEVLALGRCGGVFRWRSDARGWRELHRSTPAELSRRGGLVWFAPGQALLGNLAGPLLAYDQRAPEGSQVRQVSDLGPLSLSKAPGEAVIIGHDRAPHLVEYREGNLQPLTSLAFDPALTFYSGASLIALASDGYGDAVLASGKICAGAVPRIPFGFDAQHGVPLGNGRSHAVVGARGRPDASLPLVLRIERRP